MTAALRLGVLGDIHLATEPHPRAAWHNAYDFDGLPARVDEAITAFERAHVHAICLIGDLTHDGSVAALGPLPHRLGEVDVPVLVAAGNHDPGHALLTAALPRSQAAQPEGRVVGGWRLAGVQVAPGPLFGARLQAAPRIDQWGEETAVLLSHFPILSFASQLAEHGMPYPGDLVGREAIAGALARREAPTIIVSGHIHARASTCTGGVLQLVQAALVEAPYECSLIEITPGTVTRHAILLAGPPADTPAPVLVATPETFLLVDGAWHPAVPLAHPSATRQLSPSG